MLVVLSQYNNSPLYPDVLGGGGTPGSPLGPGGPGGPMFPLRLGRSISWMRRFNPGRSEFTESIMAIHVHVNISQSVC